MCNSALSLWKIWFFGGISNSGAAPAKYRSNFTKLVPTFQWGSAASTRASNSRVGDPCRFDINRSGARFSFPPKMPITDCQCQCLIVHCCTLFLWYLDHHRNQNNNEKGHLVGEPTLSVVNVTISINNKCHSDLRSTGHLLYDELRCQLWPRAISPDQWQEWGEFYRIRSLGKKNPRWATGCCPPTNQSRWCQPNRLVRWDISGKIYKYKNIRIRIHNFKWCQPNKVKRGPRYVGYLYFKWYTITKTNVK